MLGGGFINTFTFRPSTTRRRVKSFLSTVKKFVTTRMSLVFTARTTL